MPHWFEDEGTGAPSLDQFRREATGRIPIPEAQRNQNGNTLTNNSTEFRHEWERDGRPQPYAVLDQKNDNFEMFYTDSRRHLHMLCVPVNEDHSLLRDMSRLHTDPHHYYPGDYKLVQEASPYAQYNNGKFITLESYAARHGHVKNDMEGNYLQENYEYGWAATHVERVDPPGTAAQIVFKARGVENYAGQQVSADGIDLHGGSTQVYREQGMDAVMQPYQPLRGAAGCIRAHNIDAYNIAKISERNDIPMRVSHSHTVIRSVNERDWQPMELGENHTGPILIKGNIAEQRSGNHSIKYRLSDLEAIGFNPHTYQGQSLDITTSQSSEQSISVVHSQEHSHHRQHDRGGYYR